MKKRFDIIISACALIFWLITFCSKHYQYNYIYAESIYLTIMGLTAFILLCLFKNTYYSLIIVFFAPFTFAHYFDAYSIPIGLYIGGIFVIAGVIAHIIIYKPKIKWHKMFWTFVLLGLSLVIGGIGYLETKIYLQQLLCLAIVYILFMFLLLFFNSTIDKIPFERITFLLCIFSLFLQIQGYLAIFISADFNFDLVSARAVKVGWGNCNNIDLILLFTLPAPLYYIFHYKLSNKSLLIFPFISCVTYFSLALFMSRGSLMIASLFMVSFIIGMIIYFVIKQKYLKILYFLSSYIIFIIVVTIFALAIHHIVSLTEYFKNYLGQVNFTNLDGRTPIYKQVLLEINDNVLFGKGLFAGFSDYVDVGDHSFQWNHSTILQALGSCGLFGLFAMIIHLVNKYFYLSQNINIEKFFLILIFLLPGLYGLFDVSYFFINFMIVLVVLMVLANDLYGDVKNPHINVLHNLKNTN